jgi:2-amino-4-hydroxy-6-hydroxymethyldihydropteridine diphosphokinase
LAYLQSVVDAMRPELVAASSVYETEPWGAANQDVYYNAALIVDSDAVDEWEWLRRGQELEEKAHRVREVHWGSRTLDVDILDVAGVTSDHPRLILPHPRAHERASRLLPWLEIDPDAVLAGRPIADLVRELPPDDIASVRRRHDIALRV